MSSYRVSEPLVSPGQWFMLEVIADRDRIVIKVNGMTVANYIDPNRPPRSGPLGLEHDQPATLIEFRKIEIKELNGTAGGTGGLPRPLPREWEAGNGTWLVIVHSISHDGNSYLFHAAVGCPFR